MAQSLTLTISDPDLLGELARYGNLNDQRRTASAALRLGLQALGSARGEIDSQALQQTAERTVTRLCDWLTSAFSDHIAVLNQHFSLDHPGSAMARLAEQHHKGVAEIQALLVEQTARKDEQRHSNRCGLTFEDGLGQLLAALAQGADDRYEATGAQEGTIRLCKVGDYVVALGTTCAAAGQRIVIEAKHDRAYGRADALAECEKARKNRDAQVAIFVWHREYGLAKGVRPLERHGRDILVLWDAEDAASDLYVEAAYWLARCLVQPPVQERRVSQARQQIVDEAITAINGLSTPLARMKKAAEEVVRQATQIGQDAATMQAQLEARVTTLREQLADLLTAA